MAVKAAKGGKSAVRIKAYDLAKHGAKATGAVSADDARQVLKRAVDAIPDAKLKSLRGGQVLIWQ